jgi:type IV pilus assembly protein PilN
MIRINLLAVDRERAKKKTKFEIGQKIAVACSFILIATVIGIGWWYWTLDKRSAKLDADIASARAEAARLNSIIQQVRQFEARKAQLQQRVGLIQQLGNGQTGAVRMLDQISRSLPDTLWLTEMKQQGPDLMIDGRCTTLTSLSDFVASLTQSGYFSKGVELVSSQADAPAAAGATASTTTPLIKFQLKAKFSMPGP